MLNSFIITPEYFTLLETGKVVRESGIEDRYIRAFEKVDAHFSINKDDNSDGVVRYCNEDNKILFYGIQECKVHSRRGSIMERLVQSLAYVYDWINPKPELKPKFKFVHLPTEKESVIVYLDNLFGSMFWTEFTFYYELHKSKKGCSASNFYKNSADVRVLISDYISRFRISCYDINNELDFKEVISEILNNCL